MVSAVAAKSAPGQSLILLTRPGGHAKIRRSEVDLLRGAKVKVRGKAEAKPRLETEPLPKKFLKRAL
jgi:hypothetical protein